MENNTENMVEHNDQTPKKKSVLWLVMGIALVVILGGAAFVGGKLLGQQKQTDSDSKFDVDFIQSEEIPKEDPLISGSVMSVDGDTLTVMSFNMSQTLGDSGGAEEVIVQEFEVEVNEDGSIDDTALPVFVNEDGEKIEIVVTNKTEVYQDVTDFGEPITLQDGQDINSMELDLPDTIEMKVEKSTAEEIGPSSIVTVWGERKGDRVIASFILFTAPFSIQLNLDN